jgi:ATP-binding cassette subfamily B protein
MKKAFAGVAALLISGIALASVAWRVLGGQATLGDLALFYGALSRGQGLVRSLLSTVGQIAANGLYLKNLFRFLDLKPEIEDPVVPIAAPATLKNEILFKQVEFSYPGSSRRALRNFSLTVPAGKVVAIVGANGAGKTTLLKLLCRLYDVTAGQIEVDGKDIRNLRIADLRRMITVLFQFPVQYHTTVRENIGLGDLSRSSIPGAVESAAVAAGAHEMIVDLPMGYDSILGRWFEKGEELSGGEWQRIALARAYARNSPIVILDEPTSFMDSWSEADWFARFRTLVGCRTAIVITHRFTIAMRADVIHVMDNGEIVESGTHDQLLSRDGLYAQSWLSQIQAGEMAAAV